MAPYDLRATGSKTGDGFQQRSGLQLPRPGRHVQWELFTLGCVSVP